MNFWERLETLRAEAESLQAIAPDSDLRAAMQDIADTATAYLAGA